MRTIAFVHVPAHALRARARVNENEMKLHADETNPSNYVLVVWKKP